MNTTLLTQCSQATFNGEINFGEVVVQLLSDGVEWYSANLQLGCTTHYYPDGSHHQYVWPTGPMPAIAADFDAAQVLAAIRAAQQGRIKYPEFLQRIAAAGVVYYTVHLQGRKAIYHGRHGEAYTEPFPPA